MKKALSLLLTCLLTIGLCTTVGLADAEKPYEGTTITLAFWEKPVQKFYDTFYEDTGIKVEYEQISGDQIFNVVNARLLAGEGPDIFGARFEDAYFSRAAAGDLVDLSDIPYWGNLDSGVVDLLRTSDGKIYGIPEAPVWICSVYNADLFAKYNIKVPTNYEEYKAACQAFLEVGVIPTVQGAADLSYVKWVGLDPVFQLLASNPKFVVGLVDGTTNFTDDLFVDALKRQKAFLDAGYLYGDSIGLTIMQAWEMFCGGNVAMINGGSYFGPNFSTIIEPTFDYQAMAMPVNAPGDPQVIPYSAVAISLCLNADGKNIEAAKSFVEYWMTHLETYADISGKPSVMATEYDYAPYANKFKVEGERIAYWREPAAIGNDYAAAMQNLILGASVEDVVAELQNKLEASR